MLHPRALLAVLVVLGTPAAGSAFVPPNHRALCAGERAALMGKWRGFAEVLDASGVPRDAHLWMRLDEESIKVEVFVGMKGPGNWGFTWNYDDVRCGGGRLELAFEARRIELRWTAPEHVAVTLVHPFVHQTVRLDLQR